MTYIVRIIQVIMSIVLALFPNLNLFFEHELRNKTNYIRQTE